MDDYEEYRINRLLSSVEREERELGERPTGSFARNIFHDELDEDPSADSDHSDADDDGFGVLQELDETTAETENGQSEGQEIAQYNVFDDFDDLEEIQLASRINNAIVIRRNGRNAYISKDKKMLWDLHPPPRQARSRARNVLRMRVSHVNDPVKNSKTPIDVWKQFFTDGMILEIVQHTNIWIDKKKNDYVREAHCRPTTPAEIKAVIGILYMLGVMKMSHINLEDVWSRNGCGVEFFPLVMSLFRFKFLLRALRFDDINSREERKLLDRLAPIRDIFEQFVENCNKNYTVSEYVTIDEMLEKFRGRCLFRQFIKSKPARYGIKIFAMCCARSFYTSNLEIYCGSQPDGPYKIDNSAKSVVERIVDPISGSGRNITVDNWFGSIPLCASLLRDHRLTLVSTLRKNKREIPPSFVDIKSMPVGGSVFGFNSECTLVSFKAKKNKQVVLLSSMHNDDIVDSNADSATFGKPEIVLFYNSTKGGVDTVDKLKEHYTVSRTSNRWTMVVFYGLLNIAGVNSFVILRKNNNDNKMIRRNFLKSLAQDLCKEQMLFRVPIKSTPSWAKKRLRELLDLPEQERPPPAEDVTSGRCYACDWRKNRASKTRCASCKFFICREHSAPAVCVSCANENEDMETSDNE